MIRREFITGAVSVSGTRAVLRLVGAIESEKPVLVRVGFLSDPHYSNVPYDWAGDDRFFSASLAKLKTAIAKFNELKLDLVIEGGDLADWSRVGGDAKGEKDVALSIAKFDEYESELLKFKGPCYHVSGNHDSCYFTPEEFYARVKNVGAKMTAGHYAFMKSQNFHLRETAVELCRRLDAVHMACPRDVFQWAEPLTRQCGFRLRDGFRWSSLRQTS